MIESGTPKIVCAQPLACLPKHPDANIVAIDYDPGASEVNQLNRIKLMLSTAFKNLEKSADKRKEA